MKRKCHPASLSALCCCLLLLSGCNPSGAFEIPDEISQGVDHVYVLRCYMHGYVGVGGEIDGLLNPDLQARPGQTVTILLINGENMVHDIALVRHAVRSNLIHQKGETVTLTFQAEVNDTYYCHIPGHLEAGMVGRFLLIEAE